MQPFQQKASPVVNLTTTGPILTYNSLRILFLFASKLQPPVHLFVLFISTMKGPNIKDWSETISLKCHLAIFSMQSQMNIFREVSLNKRKKIKSS